MRDVFIDPDAPAKRPSPRGGRFSSQAVESRKALFFCLPPAAIISNLRRDLEGVR